MQHYLFRSNNNSAATVEESQRKKTVMDVNNAISPDVSGALQQGRAVEDGIELATANADSAGNQVSNYVSEINTSQLKEDGTNVAQKVGTHTNHAGLAVAGIGGAAVASASQQSREAAATAITLSTKVTSEAHNALGTALATLKDLPVENFEFPPGINIPSVDFSTIANDTTIISKGVMKFIESPAVETAASNAADLCSKITEYVPLDLAKFEIIRDFYQILG